MPKNSSEADAIAEYYFKNENKLNNSLLHILFKILFDNLLQQLPKSSANQNELSHCINCHKSVNKCLSPNNDPQNAKYLNRYLLSMTKKIKEISKRMEKLKDNDKLSTDVLAKTKSIENLENLNKSLEKLTNEFKLLDETNKGAEGQLTCVVHSINHLSEKFEACTKNFDSILKTVAQQNSSVKDNNVKVMKDPQSYLDWISDVKDSKHGQKFLKKLESQLLKTLESEKQINEKMYEEKLELDRQLMKEHFRQKLSEVVTFNMHFNFYCNILHMSYTRS